MSTCAMNHLEIQTTTSSLHYCFGPKMLSFLYLTWFCRTTNICREIKNVLETAVFMKVTLCFKHYKFFNFSPETWNINSCLQQCAGRQRTFLQIESGWYTGLSIALRRELSMTIILLSFLMEAVLRHGVDRFILDNLQGGPSTASSLTPPSRSRISNILCRG